MRKWKQKHLWIKISSTTKLWTGKIWEGLIQYRRFNQISNYKNNFQQKIDEDFAEESAK